MSLEREIRIVPEELHLVIRAAERRHGYRLNIDDFDFLAMTIANFTNAAIDKFVAGAKEHHEDGGTFVENVNHSREITMEIIDLLMYHSANQKKHNGNNAKTVNGN